MKLFTELENFFHSLVHIFFNSSMSSWKHKNVDDYANCESFLELSIYSK
jgi:hypothetical protein